MNYTSYDANNKSIFNINNISVNNRMSKTTYEKRNKKSNIFNHKSHNLSRNFKKIADIGSKAKKLSNTAYPALFSNYKKNKNEINFKNPKLIRSNSFFIFYSFFLFFLFPT